MAKSKASSTSSASKTSAKTFKSSVSYPAETAKRSLMHESKQLSDPKHYLDSLYSPDREDAHEIEERMGQLEKSEVTKLISQVFRAVVMANVSKSVLNATNITDLVLKQQTWLDPKVYKSKKEGPKFWSWLYDHVNYQAEITLNCGVALRVESQAGFPKKSSWLLVNRPLPDKKPYSTSNYDANVLVASCDSSAALRGLLMTILAVLMMRRSTNKNGVPHDELLEDIERIEKTMRSAGHDEDSGFDVEEAIKRLIYQKYLKKTNSKQKDPNTGAVIYVYECGERGLVEIDSRDVMRFIMMTLDVEHLDDDVMKQYLEGN